MDAAETGQFGGFHSSNLENPMLTEVQKQWVAALRSGKYEQGNVQLRSEEDRYCCLGVACELAVEAGVIEPARGSVSGSFLYGNHSSLLPEAVLKWMDLRTVSGGFYGRGQSLAAMNDNGATFEEIADLIESEPAGLFV
jgi:hypothetical protein